MYSLSVTKEKEMESRQSISIEIQRLMELYGNDPGAGIYPVLSQNAADNWYRRSKQTGNEHDGDSRLPNFFFD